MGIFDAECDIYATYRVRLKFRDRLMGGVPKNPKLIQSWIATGTGLTDEEQWRRMSEQTIRELIPGLPDGLTREEVLEIASERLAADRFTNGFKRDLIGGLYLEARCVKAMLKEVTNILFAHMRWGPTSKGPKGFLAERAFVSPQRIYVGREEPDDRELFIAHVMGPSGPQNSLSLVEYIVEPEIEFLVKVLADCIDAGIWKALWVHAQNNGLGAKRSQGAGTFDILEWTKLSGPSVDFKKMEMTMARQPAAKPAARGKA